MDLADIKPIEKRYNVEHPATGEETGMILTLACAHDERVKEAIRAVNDEILKAGKDMPEADQRRLDDAFAACYVVGLEFTDVVKEVDGEEVAEKATWNGKTPKYSDKLAREICAIPAIKEQVLFEVRRTKDFYKA